MADHWTDEHEARARELADVKCRVAGGHFGSPVCPRCEALVDAFRSFAEPIIAERDAARVELTALKGEHPVLLAIRDAVLVLLDSDAWGCSAAQAIENCREAILANALGAAAPGEIWARRSKELEALLARLQAAEAELAGIKALVGRLESWTHEMGSALCPTADTYGEGVRASKGQVAEIISRATTSAIRSATNPDPVSSKLVAAATPPAPRFAVGQRVRYRNPREQELYGRPGEDFEVVKLDPQPTLVIIRGPGRWRRTVTEADLEPVDPPATAWSAGEQAALAEIVRDTEAAAAELREVEQSMVICALCGHLRKIHVDDHGCKGAVTGHEGKGYSPCDCEAFQPPATGPGEGQP